MYLRSTTRQLVEYTPAASISILDVYPVGSVYISLSSSFDPNTSFGGTWTKFGAGKCLWGVDSNNSGLGSNIEAGLPDIEGNYPWGLDEWFYQNVGYETDSDNAFYFPRGVWNDPKGASWGNTQHAGWYQARFKASRHNPIYGKSSTVQPPAICVIFWKRTA